MNTLKKIITLTLIIGLIFNSYAPILVSASELKEFLNTEIVAMDNIDSKGKIEVDTHLVLPMINGNNINIIFRLRENDQEVSINLNNINKTADGIYMNNYTLGDQNIRIVATKRDKDGHILSGIDYKNNIVYLNINIYDLKQGDYQITLEGKNYQTFTQNITLDNYSKRVTLTNEKGMFTIGDLNNDNIVDQKDEALLLQAIEEQNIEYDLNLDGILDIADLNYLTAVIKGLAKEAKIEDIDAIINSKNIKFELTDTILEENNNLSNLFTDEEVVSLKTKDDSTINKDNPLKLAIDLNNLKMSEIRLLGGEDSPMTMEFIIETASGEVIRKSATNKSTQEVHYFTDEAPAGTIVIDLGKEIAVKKVAIVITETKTNKLADIAKIEFLNNVKVETKMPDNFYTPKITNIDTSVSEQLTVSFANVPNITGYEVKVIGPKMENGVIFATTYNNFTIEDLKNYATYKIYVQAVNQEWRSGWSEPVEASPEAKRIPPVVDMVSATANYSGIDFSWKAMDDTKTYNLYYREVGTEDWLSIKEIKENKYSLKGLKAGVSYEAYLTGVNDLGEGNKSEIVRTKTKKAEATITPKYKLINDYNEITKRTNHIKNVIYSDGTMVNGDNYAMVDDNYLSYWELNNWQASSHYYSIGNPIIILDDVYMMDEFVITVPDSYPYIYKNGTYNQEADNKNDVLVHYWNGEEKKNEKNKNTVQGVLNTKKDENGRTYYVLKLDSPIMADSIQLGLTVVNNNNLINIAEIKFYEYDSLVNDVAKLFVDDLRVELQSDVTKETIANLRKRADIKDNGEYNPYRDSIIKDLDYAEKILNDEDLDDVITLNPHISNYYNNHLGFAMTISDYQPLGVVVRPKETLTVYVGSKGNVNAEIIYTQYHAEADNWNKVGSQKLVKGQNIINIDQIGSGTSERGGSVYIRFTSMPDVNNPIKIRVSGGTKIPVIDTTNLTNENSKKEKIKNYIENLHEYNASLESLYAQDNKVFDSKNSVLASTEIITRHGLFSVSSIAVDDALTTGTNGIDEEVNRLYESLEAFDEMMLLFYRQKGLKENAIDNKDELPKARINIRYMRMFDGAFMYAGGYHIGIEYGSIAGLIQAKRNTSDKTGYFGWGISHEIGHQINQSSTVYAEVTNNVYALLAQTSNDVDKSRLETSNIYEKIYEKVSSHTLGRSQNVFVQLGMYWQLHLAYDEEKTFEDANSIYAKINHLTRTYENKDNYSKDDLLIYFASLSAQKNLLDYFLKWGIKASAKMTNLIESLNLEKETRAIYYLNDEARRYKLNKEDAMAYDTLVLASLNEISNQDKRVIINFEVNKDSNKILGYEILRNGESIGFVQGNVHTFIDNIGSENNRAYTYSVVAYDYYLNKTKETTLEEVKISHDGSINKNNFIIESNVKEQTEKIDYEAEDFDYTKTKVNNLIDNNPRTYFNGTEKYQKLDENGNLTTDSLNPYIIINLNSKMAISGIKYQAALKNGKLLDNTIVDYKIYLSSDKKTWEQVRTGKFNLTKDNNYTNTIYFQKESTTSEVELWTYQDISYIKIEAVGNKNGLSGAEVDVIAPPTDNIEISLTEDNKPVMGVLDSDYCYLTKGCSTTEGIIKKGSVILKGTYAGSPSFNILTITDSNNPNNIYGGYQLFFAEVNKDLSVYEIANGTWLYVMSEEEYEKMRMSTTNIRAYLYRVNDALSLEGQRLTSTSKTISNLVPYLDLPKITLTDKDINK